MKYPKTFHLPFSLGLQNNDRKIKSLEELEGKEVVITEKLDGENTSFHHDNIHARSENQTDHPSRSFVKRLHGSVAHLIPDHIQIIGENIYAKHSIFYDALSDFFYVFGVIDKKREVFLSFFDTLDWCMKLNLKMVPVLQIGLYSPDAFQMPSKSYFGPKVEGYVVRSTEEFSVRHFGIKSAKFVREKHIQTNEHWSKEWVPNKLKEGTQLWYA